MKETTLRILKNGWLILLVLLAGCKLPFDIPFLPKQPLVECPGLSIGILIGADTDPIAVEQRLGYEFALQQINATGGPAGCELSLVYQTESSTSNQDQIHRAVRSLVEDGNVAAILGGTTDDASMQAASLVNYFSVPMVIPSASGNHILPSENPWAFRLNIGDDSYAHAALTMVKNELGTGQKIAILFEDSTPGHDIAVSTVTAINDLQMTLAAYLPVDSASTNTQNLVDSLLAAEPDVLYLIFTQPDDAADILQTLEDAAFPLPLLVITQGGGFSNGSFLYADDGSANVLSENLIISADWVNNPGTAGLDELTQAYATYTTQVNGKASPLTDYSAAAYKSLMIVSDALNDNLTGIVDWTNVKKIRETLREGLSAYDENSDLWGKIDFSTAGQNQGTALIAQIQNGASTIVYPSDYALARPILNLSSFDLGSDSSTSDITITDATPTGGQ